MLGAVELTYLPRRAWPEAAQWPLNRRRVRERGWCAESRCELRQWAGEKSRGSYPNLIYKCACENVGYAHAHIICIINSAAASTLQR